MTASDPSTAIDAAGWTAEMWIPFTQLRFTNATSTNGHLDGRAGTAVNFTTANGAQLTLQGATSEGLDSTAHYSNNGGLGFQGDDVTYTTNRRFAADLYFRIPEGRRPWIASLDREGRGLVHASTARLRGALRPSGFRTSPSSWARRAPFLMHCHSASASSRIGTVKVRSEPSPAPQLRVPETSSKSTPAVAVMAVAA